MRSRNLARLLKHCRAGPGEIVRTLAASRPPWHRPRRLVGRSDFHGSDDVIALDFAAEFVPGESHSIEGDIQRKGDVGAAQGHSLENLAAVAGACHPLDLLEVLFYERRVAKLPAGDAQLPLP